MEAGRRAAKRRSPPPRRIRVLATHEDSFFLFLRLRSFSCSPSGAAQTQTTTFNRPSLSNAPISERGKHTESEVRRDTKIDAAELGCLLFHRARASTVRSSAVPSASASRHQDRSHAVRTQHNDSAISAAATPPASCRHHSRAR